MPDNDKNPCPAGAKREPSDVKIIGKPDRWFLLSKASSEEFGWMKSTKAMIIDGLGVLVQATTEVDGHVAEALSFIPGATVVAEKNGTGNYLVRSS
jgi:hypothetical protein